MRSVAPRSLRLRLIIIISAVSGIAVSGSFFALHAAVGSELRGRIDDELAAQKTEFEAQVPPTVWNDPAELERRVRQFISGQRYHPESRIFAIEAVGRAPVSNQQEIVEREIEDEKGEEAEESGEDGRGLLQAPDGFATVANEETGKLRVLTAPLEVDGRRVGTFRAADPLTSVDRALEELRNTFLLVGAGALLLAVLIAVWLAGVITNPLRRMSRVASQVDAGDLAHRIDYSSPDELGQLASAFNGMLDRLETGFSRQREFVSDASHELRSPLTTLRGRIELLLREPDTSEQARAEAKALLREVQRMERLADELLTLAQAEGGTLVHPRPIPVEDFVEDLRRDLPLLGQRSYRVESKVTGTLQGDPDRLIQVLRNLVTNAVRHTDAEGHITVRIDPVDGDLRFQVSDDGEGIPPEQLERIFDRFYRTDPGRARDRGGTGLGLAIARAIVEAHGGTISADSTPGRGTTFIFNVPGFSHRDPMT